MDAGSRFVISIILLAGVTLVGTLGYMMIEDAPLSDAAYMTIVTISTVGYREVIDLSPTGRVFTMIFIMAGVGCVYYATVSLVTFFIGGELRAMREKLKVQKKINGLSHHIVVCGYGRMGSSIVDQLRQHGRRDLVLVENDADKIATLEKEGILFVQGDASEEESLKAAGITRAKSLVATLPRDSDNVYVTLTARGLHPDLFIITRAEATSTEGKLIRAGADRVVCPQVIGALRVSNLIIRPNVVDFVDGAAKGVEFEITEYLVTTESPLAGRNLRDSGLRQKTGAMVIAIKRPDGTSLFNPGADATFQAGDTLIMIGQLNITEQLAQL